MKRGSIFGKQGVVAEYLPWLILGLVVLGVIMTLIFVLRVEGITLIDKIKNLFRF
jgi:hypothetical protein